MSSPLLLWIICCVDTLFVYIVIVFDAFVFGYGFTLTVRVSGSRRVWRMAILSRLRGTVFICIFSFIATLSLCIRPSIVRPASGPSTSCLENVSPCQAMYGVMSTYWELAFIISTVMLSPHCSVKPSLACSDLSAVKVYSDIL